MTDKKEIRRQVRLQRQEISEHMAIESSLALVDQLKKFTPLQNALIIATYLTNDGELKTDSATEFLSAAGKSVCLPSIHPLDNRCLAFCQFAGFDLFCCGKRGRESYTTSCTFNTVGGHVASAHCPTHPCGVNTACDIAYGSADNCNSAIA